MKSISDIRIQCNPNRKRFQISHLSHSLEGIVGRFHSVAVGECAFDPTVSKGIGRSRPECRRGADQSVTGLDQSVTGLDQSVTRPDQSVTRPDQSVSPRLRPGCPRGQIRASRGPDQSVSTRLRPGCPRGQIRASRGPDQSVPRTLPHSTPASRRAPPRRMSCSETSTRSSSKARMASARRIMPATMVGARSGCRPTTWRR
jgi:hypothetical protein